MGDDHRRGHGDVHRFFLKALLPPELHKWEPKEPPLVPFGTPWAYVELQAAKARGKTIAEWRDIPVDQRALTLAGDMAQNTIENYAMSIAEGRAKVKAARDSKTALSEARRQR